MEFQKYINPKLKRLNASRESLVQDSYLRRVISPDGKLALYNYTNKTNSANLWNYHTLNSRGHVYEIETGKMIVRPFPKFFNLKEHHQELRDQIITSKGFEVLEKMDGSLGIAYWYDGKWRINTRGSFTSPQAKRGTSILEKYSLDSVPTQITVLVEIIYPEKIIVNYGSREELVLIGGIKTSSGEELSYENLRELSQKTGFPLPKRYQFDSIGQILSIQSTLSHNHEGFVIKLNDGYRVKIKTTEYLEVLKIGVNLTRKGLFQSMIDGKVPSGVVESIPEEVRSELLPEVKYLEKIYSQIRDKFQEGYRKFQNQEDDLTPRRLSQVLSMSSIPKSEWCGYFLILKKRSLDPVIIKRLKKHL